MGASEEEGETNLEYFQCQKLPWLRTCLRERGIQTTSGGRADNNAEGSFIHVV